MVFSIILSTPYLKGLDGKSIRSVEMANPPSSSTTITERSTPGGFTKFIRNTRAFSELVGRPARSGRRVITVS